MIGRRGRDKVLCTWATGPHEQLLALTRPSLEQYADRHGYDVELRTTPATHGRPASWGKVELLRELVATHQVVVWIDADAVIVDQRADMASELRPGRDLYVVAHRYDGNVLPNFGVVMMRGGAWSERFLARLWDRTEFLEHRWWENAGVIEMLGYDDHWPWQTRADGVALGYGDAPITWRRPTMTRLRTRFIDKRWNSVWADESPEPVIQHFPGKSQEERLQMMGDALARARS